MTVFIPAQYDGSKPACVYVKTDGYNPREKPLLETLIATKEMPVTIGVFVRPGDLPATVKNTIGRRNRCFEYDGMGDNNVRFLVDELLPFVAKQFDLKLSTSGNDRCIAGGSSGGIAAFNAAWERPDAFSRVYANSGSFVAFRGGHEFPTLVRKFEAKPIRAYLTTGTNDMENCAGDWFLLDQEMDKALKFSGYDYVVPHHQRRARRRLLRLLSGSDELPLEGLAQAGSSRAECAAGARHHPSRRNVATGRRRTGMTPGGRPATPAARCFSWTARTTRSAASTSTARSSVFLSDAGQANSLSFGAARRALRGFEPDREDHELRRVGQRQPGRRRHSRATCPRHPDGGLYVTSNGDKPEDPARSGSSRTARRRGSTRV